MIVYCVINIRINENIKKRIIFSKLIFLIVYISLIICLKNYYYINSYLEANLEKENDQRKCI